MLDSLKSPLALVGRVLLALMFVKSGFGKLGNIDGTAAYIASGGLPMPAVLALLVGLLELSGGLALIVGFKARWAALALGVFTLLASVLFHKFWAVPAEQQMVQQLMFLKNMVVQRAAAQPTPAPSAPSAETVAKAKVDPELEARRKKSETEQADKQKAEDVKVAAQRAENCQRAKSHMPRTRCVMPSRNAGGALMIRLCTIGAAQ